MKILNKLQIHSEKQMKNEELLSLRGGYDDNNCNIRDCTGSSCSETSGPCTKCVLHPNQHYYICVEP
jgi:hypothetical protein